MPDWKTRLYDSYLSTGQARAPDHAASLDNPYLRQIIARALPADQEIAIVDLACGHGRLIHNLKRSGYRRVQGVDVSPEQVAAAHRLGLDEVQCQPVDQFLQEAGDASFDAVFLMDILEHLEPQEAFDLLDQVHRVLKPRGVVVVHVPNGEGLFGMRVRYGDFTHRCAYTAQSMRQVLTACGFELRQCLEDKPVIHGVMSLFRYLVWQILTAPVRLLLTAETGAGGHILSQNLLVIAGKPAGRATAAIAAGRD